MAVAIKPVVKKDTSSGLLGVAGQAAGNFLGGPIGGAVGGQLGQQASGAGETSPTVASTPVARMKSSLQSNPITQLQQGKAALASMDEDSRRELSPILDEALRKASKQGVA